MKKITLILTLILFGLIKVEPLLSKEFHVTYKVDGPPDSYYQKMDFELETSPEVCHSLIVYLQVAATFLFVWVIYAVGHWVGYVKGYNVGKGESEN